MTIDETLRKELDQLRQRDLDRSLRPLEELRGARATIRGRRVTVFASNDYLGLSQRPEVIEAAADALRTWGAGAGGSRLLTGSHALHRDLEAKLAACLGKEAALVFPSGYMANLAAVTSLVGPGDAIVADRLCHASLIDAARLSGARVFVYAHADAGHAEQALARAKGYRRRLLITESLFSMDGDVAPLEALAAAARRHEAITLLDEAHAVGVWGPKGEGFAASAKIGFDVLMGTLSKSFGAQGGFVCASRTVTDWIVNKGRSFIFTTGLSPAVAGAASKALEVSQGGGHLREKVHRLAARLRTGLQSIGLDTLDSTSQIVPVWIGEAGETRRVADALLEQGFYAPAIRPPTVRAGSCRLRLSITANHLEKDIDGLLSALEASRVAATRRVDAVAKGVTA
jgi:8-amino-7-oxononanoate synthase